MQLVLRRTEVKIVILVILVTITACNFALPATTAQQVPTPQPAKQIPDCSVTVPGVSAGMGMFTILTKLGVEDYPNADPAILVNGHEETKMYDPQPGDFIVLATKPDECNGTYVAARSVEFNFKQGEWRDISGFQSSVTDDRVRNALEQVCEGIRWWQYNSHFSGDLATGGCNFTTAVKISRADGSMSCEHYATMSEAYEANRTNLDDIKSMAFYSAGEQKSPSEVNYCGN